MAITAGLIGLGLMGKPMAQNLLKAGFPTTVWNRKRSAADELVKAGARLAANPREAASASDVLLMIVSDPQAVESVLHGSDGVLAGLRRGSILIDSSTVTPELARRTATECAERGADYLDAPVTGGDWGARAAELVFMIGGPEPVFERAKPVFAALGKKFFLLGPHGAGQTIKLAMNLLLALEVDAFAEALAIVTRAGLVGEKLVEVMQSSMGRATVLDVKAPMMLKKEYAASFPLALMHKDLRLALELAKQEGLTLPAAEGAFHVYSTVKEQSKDNPDYAAVARFWEKGRSASSFGGYPRKEAEGQIT
ncbi:MAG TPA: NAD(P)-dependent oxidoreductase [Candidatus Acidoferrum sp.]|nr:NAD(P)-dependent oxidoreductase [Candidatus Acidoferrum sp.]